MSGLKKILIIKMSSMGDVIHMMPALTDAVRAIPHLQIDWVVEENFVDLPALHPQIHRVIPVALRRWRKNLLDRQTHSEIRKFIKQLRWDKYDLVIDAQGLGKSGIIARLAKGKKYGLSWSSAREPWVSFFYNRRIPVAKQLHAIERLRLLLAQSLEYTKPDTPVDYGIELQASPITFSCSNKTPYCLFFHGTTWTTKQWPVAHWINLAQKMAEKGFYIGLPWGNEQEHTQAQQIALAHINCFVLPALRLSELALIIKNAVFIISVDTGLAHLAAALGKECIVLYGPTDPSKIGTLGEKQIHLISGKSCTPQCSKNHCTYMGQETCMAEIRGAIVDNTLSVFRENQLCNN